ncbi:MAG: recombinase family protein [Bacteroidota bacterium]|jgi:DNA invertase Pin-like site-specific DNA recombinase
MKKYVVYYRVSTEKQGGSGLGIESQKTYINHYLNNSDSEIVKEFTEIASAKYYNCKQRPLLCEAIEYCKKNNCILAVAKLDRLSRNTEHALRIYSELNGKIFSCDVPQMDKFTLTIFMAIADRERELISIRTKNALSEKSKKGVKLGSPQNLTQEAIKKAHKGNQLRKEFNDNTMKCRNYANMLRADGKTLQAIADILNSEGHKTPNNKKFTRIAVSRLLEPK